MELTMQVEPSGWARLRFADNQVAVTVRVSCASDVLANVIGVIARTAVGSESAETVLGLEPGEARVRIVRHDDAWSMVVVEVGEHWGAGGSVGFPVETRLLARLGLDLAASVDRGAYLDSWGSGGTWPTEALERLATLHND